MENIDQNCELKTIILSKLYSNFFSPFSKDSEIIIKKCLSQETIYCYVKQYIDLLSFKKIKNRYECLDERVKEVIVKYIPLGEEKNGLFYNTVFLYLYLFCFYYYKKSHQCSL